MLHHILVPAFIAGPSSELTGDNTVDTGVLSCRSSIHLTTTGRTIYFIIIDQPDAEGNGDDERHERRAAKRQREPNLAKLPLPMKHGHRIYHLLRRLACSSSLLIRGPSLPFASHQAGTPFIAPFRLSADLEILPEALASEDFKKVVTANGRDRLAF